MHDEQQKTWPKVPLPQAQREPPRVTIKQWDGPQLTPHTFAEQYVNAKGNILQKERDWKGLEISPESAATASHRAVSASRQLEVLQKLNDAHSNNEELGLTCSLITRKRLINV